MKAQTVFAALISLAVPLPASAQFFPTHSAAPVHSDYPLQVGGYIMFGVQSDASPSSSANAALGTVGLYADWQRHRVRPGLDLRVSGGDGAVQGTSVGPRVSFAVAPFHPYVEALFGPANFYVYGGSAATGETREGVSSTFVAGVDADLSPNTRWRIVEITRGSFSSLAGSTPLTISTGFTLHVP